MLKIVKMLLVVVLMLMSFVLGLKYTQIENIIKKSENVVIKSTDNQKTKVLKESDIKEEVIDVIDIVENVIEPEITGVIPEEVQPVTENVVSDGENVVENVIVEESVTGNVVVEENTATENVVNTTNEPVVDPEATPLL
ncbi:MAG: hypothetical protein LBS34_00850 [Rickettsiales bacterium]|nr:hypothetical protein [Rickettsiales bacterium]